MKLIARPDTIRQAIDAQQRALNDLLFSRQQWAMKNEIEAARRRIEVMNNLMKTAR